MNNLNKLLVLAFVSLISIGISAQDKNKKMQFEVNGKCDMCKVRIEKAALGVEGVKFANWDIPSHQLTIIADERKTNSMQVKMAIAQVGHDSQELTAPQEVYDGIHACCKYREDNSDDSRHHKDGHHGEHKEHGDGHKDHH